jgi:hypothetical protein
MAHPRCYIGRTLDTALGASTPGANAGPPPSGILVPQHTEQRT